MTQRLAVLALGFLLVVQTVPAQEPKIPQLVRRVTDFTNTLTRSELDALETDIARFEDTTSTQIVVVMISTLGDGSLEDYSLRVAEANQIGQKGKDNGALLLVVKDDRLMRIEVGYGLEGAIPDGVAGQIIRREITPFFRGGDYYAGIKAGVDALMLASRNEYKADAKESDDEIPVVAIILFVLFLFFLMSSNRKHMRGARRSGFPIFYGGSGGSGSSWGSSGGGGSGFGGFSGGGGSFGGGGASGGW